MDSVFEQLNNLKIQVEKLASDNEKLTTENKKQTLEQLKNNIIEDLKKNENGVTNNRVAINFLKENNMLKLDDFITSDKQFPTLPCCTMEMLITEFNYDPTVTYDDIFNLPYETMKMFVQKKKYIPDISIINKIFKKDYVFSTSTFEKEIFMTDTFFADCSKTKIGDLLVKQMNFNFFGKLRTPKEAIIIDIPEILEEAIDENNFDLIENLFNFDDDDKHFEKFVKLLIKKNRFLTLNCVGSKIKDKFLNKIQKQVYIIVCDANFDDGINYCEIIKCVFKVEEIHQQYLKLLGNSEWNDVNILLLHCLSEPIFFRKIIDNIISSHCSIGYSFSFKILFNLVNDTDFKKKCINEETPKIIINKLFKTYISLELPFPKEICNKIEITYKKN